MSSYASANDNESIEDYIVRYIKEALQIECGKEITRAGFIQWVRSEELMKTLSGKDGIPDSWDEVIRASKIFASLRSLKQQRDFQQTHNNNTNKGNQSV